VSSGTRGFEGAVSRDGVPATTSELELKPRPTPLEVKGGFGVAVPSSPATTAELVLKSRPTSLEISGGFGAAMPSSPAPAVAPKPTPPSRRSERRAKRHRHVFAFALEVFVGLCVMTGSSSVIEPQEWRKAEAALQRRLHRLRYVPTTGPRRINLPTWASRFFLTSEINARESMSAVWERSLDSARRFCRPLTGSDRQTGLNDDDEAVLRTELDFDGVYTLSSAVRDGTFRKIIPEQLAVPPDDHQPLDVSKLFRWPFDELFCDRNLRRMMKTPDELLLGGPPPRCRVSVAAGHDYGQVIRKFDGANMLRFHREGEGPDGPINGLFAVAKSPTAQRPVCDDRAGNFMFEQARLHSIYQEIIATDPARTLALGLTTNLTAQPNPSTLGMAPDGAFAGMATDKKSFYYTMLMLEFLIPYQRLPRIRGEEIGRAPGWYDVYMTVCGMGNWLAALLAQLVHVEISRRVSAKPVLLRSPSAQLPARRRRYDRLALAANDGKIAARDVPGFFQRELTRAGHPGFQAFPPDVLMPIDVFNFEVCTVSQIRRAAPGHRSHVELRSHCTTPANQGRLALAHAKHLSRRGRVRQVLALMALYIDDNNSFYYSCGFDGATADKETMSIARCHTLLVILTSLGHGFLESWGKLRWPSNDPGKALGVSFVFERGGRLRWEVAPERRLRSRNVRLAIARSPAAVVTEDVLDSAIGNLVWEQLVHRSFLSTLRVTYKARHSKFRPDGLIRLTPALRRELWLTAMLAPCYFAETAPVGDRLTTYDASGATKTHNGGFGVAFRRGLGELAAAELCVTTYGQFGSLVAYQEPAPGEIPLDRGRTELSHRACTQISRLLRFNWESPRGPWVATYRGVYRHPPAYIAIGESLVGDLAARDASQGRGRADQPIELFLGGDNSVACSTYFKGRSSVARLNQNCRLMAVSEFTRRVRFRHFWLPSKSNPSDGPSRWHDEPEIRNRIGRIHAEWVRDLTNDGDVEKRPGPVNFKRRRVFRHPFAGKHFGVAPRSERKELGGDHSLLGLKVGEEAFARYLSGFEGINTFIRVRGYKEPSYALALAAYVNYGLNSRTFTYATARVAITAVAYFLPEVKATGQLKMANKYLAAWKKLEPGVSHVPVPRHINELLALQLMQSGLPGSFDAGVAVLLGFDTYARRNELYLLREQDVLLPGCAGNFVADKGTLYFRLTKAGRPQTVMLDNAKTIRYLESFQARKVASGRQMTATTAFFDFGKKSLLSWYKWAQKKIGYAEPRFVLHSLRHGGATNDYMTGRRDVGGVKVRGRWGSYAAMEVYLQIGQANLSSAKTPRKVDRWFNRDLAKARRRLRRLFDDLDQRYPPAPVA
jgi:hypothetical protein